MKIACISAANVKKARDNSTSIKACKIVEELVHSKQGDNVEVDIIPLLDYNLSPCIMCGECNGKNICAYDEDFNKIFAKLCEADAVFVVVPHYAPIPSKLLMLFEKFEEFCFVGGYNDKSYRMPLYGKVAAVIAHGGCPEREEVFQYYKEALVEPVHNALLSSQMDVVTIDENNKGVVFGISKMNRVENEILPNFELEWEVIKGRIEPLVNKVLDKITNK